MNKLFIVLLSLVALVTIFLFYNIFHKIPLATINGYGFYLEIAKTPQEQEVGLSKYSSYPNYKAMYFPFDSPGYYTFWMKGMRFPIDILFIRNGKIITIAESVPAPLKDQTTLPIYRPTAPVDAVLEIKAGLSRLYGFHAGDSVDLFK